MDMDTLRLVENQLGQSLTPSDETHLPLDLHLQRFMLPPQDGKPRYLALDGQLIALNLAGLQLRDEQLGFLTQPGLAHLKALNLCQNALASLSLPDLPALTYLELSENKGLTELTSPIPFPSSSGSTWERRGCGGYA